MSRLEPMLELLESASASLSSVTDPDEARRVHIADSLSGLAVPEVASASRVVDIGTGAGFPGIPLAVEKPEAQFTLIDSVGRKARFVDGVIERLGLRNARTRHMRSEEWAAGDGREAANLVTARAVAPLAALAELASPLLEDGGCLVAWKGERVEAEEEALAGLNNQLSMSLLRIVPVHPFPESRQRHLYVVLKNGPTPENLPRRPGMVRKRPLSA